MIQNRRIELLEAWKDRLFQELSISEIMKITGKNTKPWVFNSLKELEKSRLLVSERKGNLDLYGLNLENPFLIHALQYLESQRHLDFPRLDMIMEIIGKVPVKGYCLLVFGSYAQNRQTSKSDLDMCFLIESQQMQKRIIPYLEEVKLNHKTGIDEHYVTFEDFMKMLLRNEENLGKQIFRNHMLFFNPDIYYRLIRKAHKHGFRP
jgi:predicted nucleotidyltransferase